MLGLNYKTSSFTIATKKAPSSIVAIDISTTLVSSTRSRLKLNIISYKLSILALRLNKLSYISILTLRLNKSKSST